MDTGIHRRGVAELGCREIGGGDRQMSCPDNYSQWEEHEWKQETWLKTRPVCGCCGEPIQDDFCYEINGEYVCEMCLDSYFVVYVDSIAL